MNSMFQASDDDDDDVCSKLMMMMFIGTRLMSKPRSKPLTTTKLRTMSKSRIEVEVKV